MKKNYIVMPGIFIPSVFFILVISIIIYGQEEKNVDSTQQKVNIAVLDLESRGKDLSIEEIKTISDRLRGELINTEKYTVIEREQMGDILREQGFQQTGACSEAACIVDAGKLLAVHKMVGGSIGKVGKAFSINIKIIDVESGKIERQVSEDMKCSKEELISTHIRNVARKIAGLEKIKKPLVNKWYFWVSMIALGAGGGVAIALLSGGDSGEVDYNDISLVVPITD